MQLQTLDINTINYNKTRKFLGPILRTYSNGLVKLINSLSKPFIAIYDFDCPLNLSGNAHFFITVKTNLKTNKLSSTLDQIRIHEQYVGEYAPIGIENLIILVIAIPDEYSNTYNKFIEGKYSQMFTKEQAKKLFIKNGLPTFEYDVYHKTALGFKRFQKKVANTFNCNIHQEDFINAEYELLSLIHI